MKKRLPIKKVLGGLVAVAAVLSLLSYAVMLLWNSILVDVTAVKAITFPQAFGILVLAKILFGGFHGGFGRRKQMWKEKMNDKWRNMTPEQREEFKQKWRNRCAGWGRPGMSPKVEKRTDVNYDAESQAQ